MIYDRIDGKLDLGLKGIHSLLLSLYTLASFKEHSIQFFSRSQSKGAGVYVQRS